MLQFWPGLLSVDFITVILDSCFCGHIIILDYCETSDDCVIPAQMASHFDQLEFIAGLLYFRLYLPNVYALHSEEFDRVLILVDRVLGNLGSPSVLSPFVFLLLSFRSAVWYSLLPETSLLSLLPRIFWCAMCPFTWFAIVQSSSWFSFLWFGFSDTAFYKPLNSVIFAPECFALYASSGSD